MSIQNNYNSLWEKYKHHELVKYYFDQLEGLKTCLETADENVLSKDVQAGRLTLENEIKDLGFKIDQKISEIRLSDKRERRETFNVCLSFLGAVLTAFGVYMAYKSVQLSQSADSPYLAPEIKFTDVNILQKVPPYIKDAVYSEAYFPVVELFLQNVGNLPAANVSSEIVILDENLKKIISKPADSEEFSNPIVKNYTVKISQIIPYHPTQLLNKTLIVLIKFKNAVTEEAYEYSYFYKISLLNSNEYKLIFEDSAVVDKIKKSNLL